jgi:sec-independent protein translocase protein TatA
MDLGPTELLIILAVILLLFGGAKLPQLARSLGQAKKEFQDGATEAGKKDSTTPVSPTTTDTV